MSVCGEGRGDEVKTDLNSHINDDCREGMPGWPSGSGSELINNQKLQMRSWGVLEKKTHQQNMFTFKLVLREEL